MADFTETSIEIGYYTDLWGPYIFTFPIATSATAADGVIPYDDTLSAVTVRAFVGNVKRSSTLANFTEISDDLIDPSYTPTIEDNTVKIKLQYPGTDYKGSKATIIFEMTLASGGKRAFYFKYIKIK